MWEGERKGMSPEWGLRGHAIEREATHISILNGMPSVKRLQEGAVLSS